MPECEHKKKSNIFLLVITLSTTVPGGTFSDFPFLKTKICELIICIKINKELTLSLSSAANNLV